MIAEEREKKRNEARNQGIQVVLKSGNSCGFKEISTCELGNSCVDSFCTGGKCIPVDVGSFCVRDDRYREHKVNADPALDQRTQDEHTEDGSDLCDFAEQTAGKVLGDLHTYFVAEFLCIPHECHTENIPEDEEEDRSNDISGNCERSAESCEDRAKCEPEYRIADTGQRSHHTDFNALDRLVFDRCAVRAVFLKSKGNTHDRGSDIRLCVKEFEMSLQSGSLFFFCRIKSLDGRDDRIAPATVLHTFIVPGALKEGRTKHDRSTVGNS